MKTTAREIMSEVLGAEKPITEAEVYATKVIKEELEAAKIREGSGEWNVFTERAAEIMAAHREEVRDMYRTSKALLREWTAKESGIRDHKAFRRMLWMGLTGNVLKDMEILGMKVL